MKTVSPNAKLVFTNLMVSVKNKSILQNVSGEAISGDLFAIMGSTGSGKTTLLNALAGRITVNGGEIILNDSPIDKQQRRRFGYVIQEDIFLSNLTLWETLYFTAMISISEKVSEKEKLERIEAIVECLGLQKCLHTVVGDIFERGLSGGEKKRANIACELLTDPDILLIDEPTSGLDSSTANTLMKQLRIYATEYNKVIVASIHQPSSQIFEMFSTLLLLSEGQTAYFGKADRVIDFVTRLEMYCNPHYNPADYLLDILTSEDTAKTLIEENRKLHESVCRYSDNIASYTFLKNTGRYNGIQLQFKRSRQRSEASKQLVRSENHDAELPLFTSGTTVITEDEWTTDRWSTSHWTQLKMLIWRSFKQSRGRILHKFDVMQSVIIAAITGVFYFQLKQSPSTIRDQMGLVLCSYAYFGFELMIMATTGCCSDRGVYMKDRAAGAYRLSAYYLAKILSEMPLVCIVPILFHTAVYWMAGLGGVDGYFLFLGMGLLHCLLVQGISDVIGFSIVDFRLCMKTVAVVNVSGFLLGGFFNTHPPEWFTWAKYTSHSHYPYAVTMTYLLGKMDPIRCNQTSIDDFPQCIGNSTEILTPRDILAGIGIELPIYYYIMIMVLALCVFRILGYLILRFKPS